MPFFDRAKRLLPTKPLRPTPPPSFAIALPASHLALEPTQTINQISRIIEVAVRLGERETALNLARKHSRAILDSSDDLNDLRFFTAVSALGDDESDYKTALEIAGRFDARNGNAYRLDYLNEYYACISRP